MVGDDANWVFEVDEMILINGDRPVGTVDRSVAVTTSMSNPFVDKMLAVRNGAIELLHAHGDDLRFG
jgi:hypothetical protein